MSAIVAQHSAGGVVARRLSGTTEVLLIKPAGRERWQLPKGMVEAGEPAEVAAVREVREEGGVEARVVTKLAPVRFFYQMGRQKFVKTVSFFLMEYESGSPSDHDDEVEDARWFPADEALTAITFDSERGTVQVALDAFVVPDNRAS